MKNVAQNKEYMRRLVLMIPPWFAVGLGYLLFTLTTDFKIHTFFYRSYGIHFSVQSIDFNIFAAAAIKEVLIFVAIIILIPIFQKVHFLALVKA